jgi:hypothetical protein
MKMNINFSNKFIFHKMNLFEKIEILFSLVSTLIFSFNIRE